MAMDAARRYAELFEEPPETWRTRGDPWLWAALRQRLGPLPLPESAAAVMTRLEQEFLLLTERPVTEAEPFFVKAFAHGGLTSGTITPQYWRTVVFPGLLATHADAAFRLKRSCWYAGELIGEEFGAGLRAMSAFHVRKCRPLKTGAGTLELTLRFLDLPGEGNECRLRLQVLERTRAFVLGRWLDRKPARLLLAQTIGHDWLQRHAGDSARHDKPLRAWLAYRDDLETPPAGESGDA